MCASARIARCPGCTPVLERVPGLWTIDLPVAGRSRTPGPTLASGRGLVDRPQSSARTAERCPDALEPSLVVRSTLLCGHPLTGVGRFPNPAGGPVGPATRETLHSSMSPGE